MFAFDSHYPVQIHDIRPVHTHEGIGRQPALIGFQASECRDGTPRHRKDSDIFAHALHVHDIRNVYPKRTVLRPNEQAASVVTPTARRRLQQAEPGIGPLGRTQKIGISYGLQEIIRSIDTESLQCIFRIGGSEDDERPGRERPHEIEPAESGHVDIHKEQVGTGIGHRGCSLHRAAARSGEPQKRRPLYIGAYLSERQRLVIYRYTTHHRFTGIFNFAV